MNKYFIYAFIIFLVSNLNVNAQNVPKFSIVAQTSIPKVLMANRILSTQYLVTNNTKVTRTLMLSPIQGVIQNPAGPNACSNPFTLTPGKSCLLNITLIASQMGAGVTTGPVICKANANKTPDPFLCSRPAEKDNLNVKIISCTSSTCLNSLKEQQIRAITRSYQQQYAIPGVLAGIWIPGQGDLIIEDGVADLSTNRPISTADHFHIASITKSFTTTIILQLAQEGRLNLNDPLSEFDIAVQNDNATLGELADMRSGIFNYSADATFIQEFAADLLRAWLPQELVDFASANPVYFSPGSSWHYSNTNTVLLGMIIEQVTGHFIGNELANRIFKPLGLNQTGGVHLPTELFREYLSILNL
ncbi:serine hydrolase domain-containing protein [Legionella shakespearei]|uniref:Serine-type D-Ala-D-Ala carboxypeptidase n=1 Tax=Legionella shakespearei DSM 23087 TaxID=1122169 RepID=A0A0W0Z7E5_9GAMM|nr:serine hydrolase domain-containing protein [Legionella shakespearei]KTD65037.1 serine-type D-Ala-D-Ala carboxypeptidase [Legionella shakespearei DSM 23087]